MQFKEVIGHNKIKKLLLAEAKRDRVSHAQMFLGEEGIGKLPLAVSFAQYLLCDNPLKADSCGECQSCTKVKHLVHPDLHFVFPVVKSAAEKVSTSDDRREEWNELFLNNPYFSLTNWQTHLNEMGKNAQIGVDESRKILKKLALKSYSGKYKIMIIWLPEKMNNSAANKLLKILEEPPESTLFFLICDSIESILPTIISRTQIIKVPSLTNEDIQGYLIKHKVPKDQAASIAGLTQGNLTEAIQILNGDTATSQFFESFVKLMRAAYSIDAIALMSIGEELASFDKENQKNFLKYGLHIFRESIMFNYLGEDFVKLESEEMDFLQKFARFINNQNISELSQEFNDAIYHIERNANAKLLFSDLVIRLTKLIKKGV